MYLPSLAHAFFWLLAISTRAYVCPFLGGAVIDVDQVEGTGNGASQPAIRTVSAEWNVPWTKANPHADLKDSGNRHSLAQWVGILGNMCDNSSWYPFLQAGTATQIDENGATTVNAWVEWFPAGAHVIPEQNMTVSPGDQMRVEVNVYTHITGHVSMKNLRTGQEYEADVKADSPEDPRFQICLGYGTAQFFQEWVIANDRGDLPVFNNITFTNVQARDRRGKAFDFSTGRKDYWNMTTDVGEHVAIPHEIDSKTFVIYSPKGGDWGPPERACS
ncbi:concanavalin A-like lectin/glucanase [Hypoxylon crocopeplum]|nr:concanavalin A-like lectin/glucanase [Hypoxylon crocopeplum]